MFQVALDQIRESIRLDPSLPWTETLVLSYPNTIDVDVNDDLNRELALYASSIVILGNRNNLNLYSYPATNKPYTAPTKLEN